MSSTKTNRRGIPWLTFVLVGLFVLLGLAVAGKLTWDATFDSSIDSAYAQWEAGDVLINYLETHDDQWPRSWDDLEPHYDPDHSMVAGWSFAELRAAIRIDFDADVDALKAASLASDQVTFDVIGGSSFFAAQFEGGPNQVVHAYFRRGLPLAPSPASVPKSGGPTVISK